MTSSSKHILAQEGILTSFSIAKRITERDFSKLKKKLNSKTINDKEFQVLLKKSVKEETKKAIEENSIPGFICNGSDLRTDEERKRIMEFTYFATIIAKKINDKNISKYHSCYIINALVNLLRLNENDFDEFHNRFSEYRGDSDEESDNTGWE